MRLAPEGDKMAAYCQVTETRPQFGHAVSHAQNKTKRRFNPNVQKKTYFVPSLRRNVTLNVSARGIKVIDVRGIESVVAELLARGEKI
jgi:large subunit ribosomal protein L28